MHMRKSNVVYKYKGLIEVMHMRKSNVVYKSEYEKWGYAALLILCKS